MSISVLPPCLADYELLEELSQDAGVYVCRARQRSLDRLVTLRMVRLDEFVDAEEAERFFRGAKAAAQIEHPALVRVFDIGQGDGWGYVTLGAVDGPTLAEYVQRNSLTSNRAAEIVLRLASAIAAAHKKGILHGGLDPLCVHIDASGQPRITGFGAAKMFTSGTMLTCSENILSPYTSPERAEGAAVSDPRVDVYGLGAILYTALTGQPPFSKSSAVELAMAISEELPIAPSKLQPRVPKPLEQICIRAMAKEPDQRYASVVEFGNALQDWLTSGNASRVGDPLSDTKRFHNESTRRLHENATNSRPPALQTSGRTWVAAFLSLVAIACAGLPWFFFTPNATAVVKTGSGSAALDETSKVTDRMPIPVDASDVTIDQRFLDQVREIDNKLSQSLPAEGWSFDVRTAAAEYESAFRIIGFEPLRESPAVLRERAHKKPLMIQEQISHWLVRWELALLDIDPPQAKRLQAVLETISDDPWTQQFLAARIHPNPNGLLRLLDTLKGDLNSDAMILVAETLAAHNLLERPESSRFLEMASGSLDDIFWVNIRLAQSMSIKAAKAFESERSKWLVQSLPSLQAAVDARPQIASLRQRLDYVLSLIDQIEGSDTSWAVKLGEDLLKRRKFKDVLSIVGPIAEKIPEDGNLLRIQGEAHLGLESYSLAMEVFLKAVSNSDYSAVSRFTSLADRLHVDGLTSDAVRLLHAMVEKYPREAMLWVSLAHKEWLNGQPEEGLKHCNKGIQLNPKIAFAYGVKAGILNSKGRYRESNQAAQRAIALQPSNAIYYLRLASNAEAVSDFETAKTNVALAIDRDPKNAFAHGSMARMLTRLDDLEGAESSFLKSVELNPRNAALRVNLANFLAWGKHDVPASILVLEAALKETASTAANRIAIAICFRNLGLNKRAIELLNETLKREPQHTESRVQRGWTHFVNGSLELATDDLKNALATDESSTIANQYMAKLYVHLGDDSSAIAFHRKACELNPEDPLCVQDLADSLYRVGKFSEAESTYQQALDLSSPESPLYEIREQKRNQCRGLIAAEDQIKTWLNGSEQPESFVNAADLCFFKIHDYVAAVSFYEKAFLSEPSLFEPSKPSESRLHAASAALLAAAGEGIPLTPVSDRAMLRHKALTLLQTELKAHTSIAKQPSLQRPQSHETLLKLQTSPHYASVRGDALTSLPEDERESWQVFWRSLEQALLLEQH